MSDAVQRLRSALRPLWEADGLDLLVLFGFTATGHTRAESDLDLGYLPGKPLDEIAVTARIVALTHRNDVDLVHLGRADPTLAMQIAGKGVVLFEKNAGAFREFQSLSFRRFVDSEKLRVAARTALDRFERRHDTR